MWGEIIRNVVTVALATALLLIVEKVPLKSRRKKSKRILLVSGAFAPFITFMLWMGIALMLSQRDGRTGIAILFLSLAAVLAFWWGRICYKIKKQ